MADQSSTFQIVIEMLAKGDGAKVTQQQLQELQKLEKQFTAEGNTRQAENIRQTTDAVKALNPELAKQADATENVTKEVEKGKTAKQQYKESLKGLALEFPLLARAMALITNPISAGIALVGTMVAALGSYTRSVMEAGQSAQAFENLQQRVESLRTVHEQLAVSTDAFEKSFAAIASSMDGPLQKLNEWNAALLLKQKLEQELDDAQLALDEEQIRSDVASGKISQSEAIQLLADKQAAARRRRAERDDTTLANQASADFVAADNAKDIAVKAKAAAAAMQPEVDAATKAAKDAATEIGDASAANAPRSAQNKRLLEFARLLEGANPLAAGVLEALNPGAAMDMTKRFPGFERNLPKVIEELEQEEKNFATQRQQAEQNAAQKGRRAAAITAEQKRLQDEASKNEQIATDKGASAEARRREIEARRANRAQTDPLIEERERRRVQRERTEAERTTAQSGLTAAERFGSDLRRGLTPELPTELDTIPEANAVAKAVADKLVSISAEQAAGLKAVFARLEQVEQQMRNKRGTSP